MNTEANREVLVFNVAPGNSLKTRVLLYVLVLFLTGLWSLSYYASKMLRQDMEALVSEQQFSTVSVVADSLNEEIQDRLTALESVASAIASSQLQKPAALQKYIDHLPLLKNYFNAGIVIYNVDGVAIADTHKSIGRIGTSFIDIETVADAIRLGKSSIGPPTVGKKLQTPVFGMTVPIRDELGKVIGGLTGVIDLRKQNFLDQVTQHGYGKTGGYVLVAPKQRLIVTATDKSRAMEVLPGPGVSTLMDRFVEGFEGSGVSKNALGTEVLASAKGIPSTNWYLAAVLPTTEAFAPIHNMQQHMWLITLALTLLAGVLAWWMIGRLLAPLASAASTLANMSVATTDVQPLTISHHDEIGQVIGGFNRMLAALAEKKEALKRNERKFLDILENVETYIYLKDLEGRYLYVNRHMCRLLGLPMADIVGQTDEVLFDAKTVASLRANDQRVLVEGVTLRVDEILCDPAGGKASTHISVKLPLRNENGEIYALCGISTDITERKKTEGDLRIAAIAFECQEGMVVLDHEWRILRVNRAYTKITGYTREAVEGDIPFFSIQNLQCHQERQAAWEHIQRHGFWHHEIWQHRKDGQRYLCRITVTAVHDENHNITHLVGNLTDVTALHWQEKERQQREIAHRTALVQEVHHRIKNNLQGITGLLHQFAVAYPETREPLDQAISQVRSIAVLHGLQGCKSMDTVRLCELTCAIANDVQAVWKTPITVDIPPQWASCILAEPEAVPMALVINELIVNAVKHSSKVGGQVQVTLRKGDRPDLIQLCIQNAGQLVHPPDSAPVKRVGLQLVDSLIPRHGVTLSREQRMDTVITRLQVEPPVITLE